MGGFIGLLQQLQQIRNTEDSLALQLNQLAKLEAYHAAGLITLIQVDNLRQNIETERANLVAGAKRVRGLARRVPDRTWDSRPIFPSPWMTV